MRSEIDIFKKNLLDLTTVLKSANHAENSISFGEARTINSTLGVQRWSWCHCKTKYKRKRCACRSASRICNSECYKSLLCENKNE